MISLWYLFYYILTDFTHFVLRFLLLTLSMHLFTSQKVVFITGSSVGIFGSE